MKRWQRAWIGGLAVFAFLILWEAATPLGWVRVAGISRPTLVGGAFVQLAASGEIYDGLYISLKGFFLGFVLAVVIGIPVGVVIGRYRFLSMLLDPLLMAIYNMPKVAMMPLLVVWFGVGFGATVAVVLLGAVFPILVNTAVGIREVDPVWVRAVRSFGGSEWDVFKKVLLPGSVPPMMTGIRLGVGRGLLGVVVSEMYASTEGIGHLIGLYGMSFRITELIAMVGVVSLLGFVFADLIRRLEVWVSKGRAEVQW
ncbi:MAG: ABC transporter permease [Thermodesulfobacteriota bacterium]|nr:ABC transporter permease [Thermodesulfobacteriota bacterium]